MGITLAVNQSHSFEQLFALAQKAEPKLSCLGGRYVYVEGYQGYLQINDIAKRMLQLIKGHSGFNEPQLALGRRLLEKVDAIYEESDSQIEHSNFLTFLLAGIRDIYRTFWRYDIKDFRQFYIADPFDQKNNSLMLGLVE